MLVEDAFGRVKKFFDETSEWSKETSDALGLLKEEVDKDVAKAAEKFAKVDVL